MLTRRLLLVPTVLLVVLGLAVPASAQPPDWLWRELLPANAPAAGGSGAMTFDESTDEVVLFGNKVEFDPGNETWTWNGETWSEVTGSGPSRREDMEMVYDPGNENIVLYGGLSDTEQALGDTWIFDDGEWHEAHPLVSPPPNHGQAMAYDPVLGQVLMFGGRGENAKETWAWDGSIWTELAPAHVPRGRHDAELAFDAHRGRLVLFGGYAASPGPNFPRKTLTWDGSNWRPEKSRTRPLGRSAFAMTSADGVVTMYGGFNGAPDYSNETWVLGRKGWRQLPLHSPGLRAVVGMTYDSARDEIIQFGGQEHSGFGFATFDETWALGS